MRMHTNNPGAVEAAIREAATSLPGVEVVSLTSHGSRSRACGLELALSGTGRSGGQWGGGGYRSATWDEWGVVLGAAFDADEDACRTRGDIFAAGMSAGPYLDLEHFAWSTGARYDGGEIPDDMHARHRWSRADVVTGAYYVDACKGCTATMRVMAHGRTFDEIR